MTNSDVFESPDPPVVVVDSGVVTSAYLRDTTGLELTFKHRSLRSAGTLVE